MSGCLNVYVVIVPGEDRPYVSTFMSSERIELARRKGWIVTLIKGSVRTDGVVGEHFERKILSGPPL